MRRSAGPVARPMRTFGAARPRSSRGAIALSPPRYGVGAADGKHGCGGGLEARPVHRLDALENEADRAADAVIGGSRAGPLSAVAYSGSAPASPAERAPGPGQPLASSTRRYFERRFGEDLGKVRIHVGPQAASRAAALDARAYTIGRDIVFGAGEYRPGTREGRHLLAHELAHSVQQSRGGASVLQRKLKVGSGLSLNTHGFTTTKSGDVYSAPKAVRKSSLWNEVFTSLLASPRTFELAGATSAQADQNLGAHMKARIGIVEFAAKKKFGFKAGKDFKMNPDFWIVTPTEYYLRPGVDPLKAIEDINNPKHVGNKAKEYMIACEAATKLTMIGGSRSVQFEDGSSADLDDWVPGDKGYIKNVKFPAVGGTPGLEGENLIYVGKNLFWGHFNPGLEYKSLAGWIDEVNRFPAPTEARLTDVRAWTKVGLA